MKASGRAQTYVTHRRCVEGTWGGTAIVREIREGMGGGKQWHRFPHASRTRSRTSDGLCVCLPLFAFFLPPNFELQQSELSSSRTSQRSQTRGDILATFDSKFEYAVADSSKLS